MPGQSRPLGFHITVYDVCPAVVDLVVKYTVKGSSKRLFESNLSHTLSTKGIHSPHKFTFLHPSGIVSYAIIRPPSKRVCHELCHKPDLPILLALHGAGLEADSHLVAHALDSVPDLPSWVLFPTGVTPWSGDDWRASFLLFSNVASNNTDWRLDTWGFRDVEAGVAAIKDWTEYVGWDGPLVDIDKWLVIGHSNGGEL